MRLIVVCAAMALLGAAPPPPSRPSAPMPVQSPYAGRDCPETPMSLARKEGKDLTWRKLSELPPAQTFMAVDRRVGGCAAPMLMGELRR